MEWEKDGAEGTIRGRNDFDQDGNPAGGFASGIGFVIVWQDGPLGRGEEKKPPNGAFLEDVIIALSQRVEFYQSANDGRLACNENDDTLYYLGEALNAQFRRTERRQKSQTEGTTQP